MLNLVEIDVGSDTEFGEVMDVIDDYQGQIMAHVARGTGGGNPSLMLGFPTKAHAEAFAMEWWKDDNDPRWAKGNVWVVDQFDRDQWIKTSDIRTRPRPAVA